MRRTLFLALVLVLSSWFDAPGQELKAKAGPSSPSPARGTPSPPSAPTAPSAADESDPALPAVVIAVTSADPFSAAVQLTMPFNRTIETSPRMQRLKSLTFDRRPGAVLKAWA